MIVAILAAFPLVGCKKSEYDASLQDPNKPSTALQQGPKRGGANAAMEAPAAAPTGQQTGNFAGGQK